MSSSLIIHTVAGVRVDHGGTSRSVPALCNALERRGVDQYLITGLPADPGIAVNLPAVRERVRTVRESWLWRQHGVGRRFRNHLWSLIKGRRAETVVHDHALWLSTNHAVAAYCKRHSLCRVVSPRGMLGRWAMGHHSWKKGLAWRLYQQTDLDRVTGFHATSELEASEIRDLGFRQPIAVIPNGIELPGEMPRRRRAAARTALFLSRVHPKKGLIHLVHAWGQADLPSDWHLLIAGPDEGGHAVEVAAVVQQLGLIEQVHFLGAIDDDNKWQLFADADVFILPSFSENFGIVVAEAMAAGLPVITTTGTPWQVLREIRAGWWVDAEVDALVAALRDFRGRSEAELALMGQRGSVFAQRSFSWDQVAEQMTAYYRFLLEGGSVPPFVKLR